MRAGPATHSDPLSTAQERPPTAAATATQTAGFNAADKLAGGGVSSSSGGVGTPSTGARGIGAVQSSTPRAPPTPGMFPSDSASASNVGSMLHQLQQLSAEDPAAFQDAAGNIASRLKSSSATATGTTARALDSLASSFRAAATTGKVPTLASTAPMTASSHVAVAKYAQSISKGGEDESLATLHDALADALAAA